METTDYVSYELAVKLKACGFDEQCHYHYDCDRGSHIIEPNYTTNDGEDCQYITADDLLEDNNGWQYCSAPTLAHAQKWLREKKELFIEVSPNFGMRARATFGITSHDFTLFDSRGHIVNDMDRSVYHSYEAALSAGLSAALELIKDK